MFDSLVTADAVAQTTRAAGLRMVVDVSNLPMADALDDLLQDEHKCVYTAAAALGVVDAGWKANEYGAPLIPKDVRCICRAQQL